MDNISLFTWHIHGSYLYYLSHAPIKIYIPRRRNQENGYLGRTSNFHWPSNVIEVEENDIKFLDFDCILYQSKENYFIDQYTSLTAKHREKPKIYLEHDPPRQHPTDTKHWIDDPNILLIHVTYFNQLMWDCGQTPTRVIEHGIQDHGYLYCGYKNEGIVVVNHIMRRGRRLGYDIFQSVRALIPLQIIGMGWEEVQGLGEIPHHSLPDFMARYRFYFHPIRYTSLGLSLLEAMMAGLPIVGLATNELSTVITNDNNGFIHTNEMELVGVMNELLLHPKLAKEWGQRARVTALERFNLNRFSKDWMNAIAEVLGEDKELKKNIVGG